MTATTDNPAPPLLTADEVARLLRVSPRTVRRLAPGLLHGVQLGKRGSWRFPRDVVARFTGKAAAQ